MAMKSKVVNRFKPTNHFVKKYLSSTADERETINKILDYAEKKLNHVAIETEEIDDETLEIIRKSHKLLKIVIKKKSKNKFILHDIIYIK